MNAGASIMLEKRTSLKKSILATFKGSVPVKTNGLPSENICGRNSDKNMGFKKYPVSKYIFLGYSEPGS